MYTELKKLMNDATYLYGPVTKEEAFNVPLVSWATEIDNNWYIGTLEQYTTYESLELVATPEEIVPPEELNSSVIPEV